MSFCLDVHASTLFSLFHAACQLCDGNWFATAKRLIFIAIAVVFIASDTCFKMVLAVSIWHHLHWDHDQPILGYMERQVCSKPSLDCVKCFAVLVDEDSPFYGLNVVLAWLAKRYVIPEIGKLARSISTYHWERKSCFQLHRHQHLRWLRLNIGAMQWWQKLSYRKILSTM